MGDIWMERLKEREVAALDDQARASYANAKARNRQAAATEKNNELLARLLARMDKFDERLSAIEPDNPVTATREEAPKDSTHDAGENESSTDKNLTPKTNLDNGGAG